MARLIAKCVFPNARWAEEDHILTTLHETELVQTLDPFATERRLEGDVEVAELLDGGEATGTHRGLSSRRERYSACQFESSTDQRRNC
jgi:hypothetical protein